MPDTEKILSRTDAEDAAYYKRAYKALLDERLILVKALEDVRKLAENMGDPGYARIAQEALDH